MKGNAHKHPKVQTKLSDVSTVSLSASANVTAAEVAAVYELLNTNESAKLEFATENLDFVAMLNIDKTYFESAEVQLYEQLVFTSEGKMRTDVNALREIDLSNLAEPLQIRLPVIDANGSEDSTVCLYWDESSDLWSDVGCTVHNSNSLRVLC